MTVLIVTAMPEEAVPIIERFGLTRRVYDLKLGFMPVDRKIEKQEKYINIDTGVELLVSGPLEHNIVSLTAECLSHQQPLPVVNFGSCGGIKKSGVEIGEAYYVKSVKKWDQHIPFKGYEWEQRDFQLQVPEGSEGKICLTGSSFVEDTNKLPEGHLIDMELYGLASLCEKFESPLSSIKYVTDYADDSSTGIFEKNVKKFRNKAVDRLEEFIPKLLNPN